MWLTNVGVSDLVRRRLQRRPQPGEMVIAVPDGVVLEHELTGQLGVRIGDTGAARSRSSSPSARIASAAAALFSLTALPPVIHLSAGNPDGTVRPLGTMLDIAVRELGRGNPGSENVLARLSELMFVEAIRRYLLELPETQLGWLAGLRDSVVGRALEALHGAPREAWTVESLGRAVACPVQCWRPDSPRWLTIRRCTT
jgi:hypothetical protein